MIASEDARLRTIFNYHGGFQQMGERAVNESINPDPNGIEPLGMDEQHVAGDLNRHFRLTLGRDEVGDSHRYLFYALALTIRDRLIERWRVTRDRRIEAHPKRINYLSMEFLMGRALSNAVINLDLEEPVRQALQNFGCSLEQVEEEEIDAGLGNGGLGRLAACFLDSCATLHLPVTGYGIRYEYGMFHQKIDNGYQVECPGSLAARRQSLGNRKS